MQTSMASQLVMDALLMVVSAWPAKGNATSLRSRSHASELYQALLTRHGLVCSMSRKGNCWNNSVAERFFLNLNGACLAAAIRPHASSSGHEPINKRVVPPQVQVRVSLKNALRGRAYPSREQK